jgi:hypothetical protein
MREKRAREHEHYVLEKLEPVRVLLLLLAI